MFVGRIVYWLNDAEILVQLLISCIQYNRVKQEHVWRMSGAVDFLDVWSYRSDFHLSIKETKFDTEESDLVS